MDIFSQQMGLRIAARRKELGLTQEELAAVVNLSVQTISTAECGRKALRPENIAKISAALHCSTDYLLLGSDWVSTPTELAYAYRNLSPIQSRCLTQIIESYLTAISSDG